VQAVVAVVLGVVELAVLVVLEVVVLVEMEPHLIQITELAQQQIRVQAEVEPVLILTLLPVVTAVLVL
jgi:hypothetical protein